MNLRPHGSHFEKIDFEIEAFALKNNGGIQLIERELRAEKPALNKGFVISKSKFLPIYAKMTNKTKYFLMPK